MLDSKTVSRQQNPRFVLNIGAISECYPDMPEHGDGTELWDRQEKKPVFTVHADYQNAICLETSGHPSHFPFTNLEHWFNRLEDKELESEGMTPTKPEFRK